jgi:hypothetical protein
MSEIEREFVELFEQGKVTMPGQVVNEVDANEHNAKLEASDDETEESDDDVEGAVSDAQEDHTDEESTDDAAEDAQADDEADASADESGDGEGESGAGTGAEEEVTTPAIAATSGDDGILVPQSSIRVGEREFTPSEFVDLQRANAWVSSLAPENIAAINDLFSGQFQLVPVADPGVAQTPASASGSATSAVSTDDDYEPLDPVVAAEVADLKTRLAQFESAQATTKAERDADIIRSTYEGYIAKKELDPATGARLQQAIFDNGWLPLFAQQTRGDIPRATEAALEFALQNDSELRNQEIQRLALAEAEKFRKDAKESSAKKRKAGSLGGAGGSVSRRVRQPSTKAEMDQAMVSEIASALNGGQES